MFNHPLGVGEYDGLVHLIDWIIHGMKNMIYVIMIMAELSISIANSLNIIINYL